MENIDIKEFRKANNISQTELASFLGVGQAFVSQMENGTRPIPKEHISKILANKKWSGPRVIEDDRSLAIVEPENKSLIPVVPIAAMGGALTGFDPTISITDCEMMISPISDAELAIGVYGDSMAPEYPNGSRVLIKKIDMTAFIEWGKAYVLSTTNGSIVKVVYPADEKSVECRSLNPAYPPFTVKYKDIHAMYKVLMCMSLK